MAEIFIFDVSEYTKNEESSLFRESSPFAYFVEKSKNEKGERARLTLAEGELLLYALSDG